MIRASRGTVERSQEANVSSIRRRLGSSRTISSVTLIAVLLLWVIISGSGRVPKLFLPTPADVFNAAAELWGSGALQRNIAITLARVLVGFSGGVALALLLGMLMGWYRVVDAVVDPLYQLWRPVPPIAIIPLFILWFGIGELSKVLVIFGGALGASLINVVSGVKNVPRIYIEAAQILGAGNWQILRRVVIPAALPYVFAGMRVALALAFGVVVASELIASVEGIGFMLMMGRNLLRTDIILVGIVLIGGFAYGLDFILRSVERRLTSWMERRSA